MCSKDSSSDIEGSRSISTRGDKLSWCRKEAKVDHFPVTTRKDFECMHTHRHTHKLSPYTGSCPPQHPRVFSDHRIASLMTEMNFETAGFHEGILFDSHQLQIFGIYLVCGVFIIFLFI